MPCIDRPIVSTPGHRALARVGRRVLRPGGAALSTVILDHARLADADVIELAPSLGHTAAEIVKAGPTSYAAIDRNPSIARRVTVVVGDLDIAHQGGVVGTGLGGANTGVVVDEAALTMQGDEGKATVVTEVTRVPYPGGCYAIHGLGITPDDIGEDYYIQLYRDLIRSIHISARPIAAAAQKELIEGVGLVVDWVDTTLMALLKIGRNTRDEGLSDFLRIARNVIVDRALRRRVQEMTVTFRRCEKDVVGITLVVHKPIL